MRALTPARATTDPPATSNHRLMRTDGTPWAAALRALSSALDGPCGVAVVPTIHAGPTRCWSWGVGLARPPIYSSISPTPMTSTRCTCLPTPARSERGRPTAVDTGPVGSSRVSRLSAHLIRQRSDSLSSQSSSLSTGHPRTVVHVAGHRKAMHVHRWTSCSLLVMRRSSGPKRAPSEGHWRSRGGTSGMRQTLHSADLACRRMSSQAEHSTTARRSPLFTPVR
jgi:hypothetical protein